MTQEALKLALEVNESMKDVLKQVNELIAENKALKEALAQPEQEPVAWMRQDGQKVTTASDRHNYPDYETRYSIPLYNTPPQRTEQEPVQVSPLEFVTMTLEKEHLIGKPIIWAEWPNREQGDA